MWREPSNRNCEICSKGSQLTSSILPKKKLGVNILTSLCSSLQSPTTALQTEHEVSSNYRSAFWVQSRMEKMGIESLEEQKKIASAGNQVDPGSVSCIYLFVDHLVVTSWLLCSFFEAGTETSSSSNACYMTGAL